MNTKKCVNCGADIPVDAAFCSFCGSATGQQNQAQPQQPVFSAQNYQDFSQPQQPYGQPQQPFGQDPGQPQDQYMPNQQPFGQPYQQKSKLAAGLLGIFLGGFGIHNFYLGYQNKALIQLLVSLIAGPLTCGIAAIAMSIWGLIEGIQILTGSINVDANNVPLKD